jgi:hypothetical protein
MFKSIIEDSETIQQTEHYKLQSSVKEKINKRQRNLISDDEWISLLKISGDYLGDIINPTKEMEYIAVRKTPSVIKWVDDPPKELQLIAVKSMLFILKSRNFELLKQEVDFISCFRKQLIEFFGHIDLLTSEDQLFEELKSEIINFDIEFFKYIKDPSDNDQINIVKLIKNSNISDNVKEEIVNLLTCQEAIDYYNNNK